MSLVGFRRNYGTSVDTTANVPINWLSFIGRHRRSFAARIRMGMKSSREDQRTRRAVCRSTGEMWTRFLISKETETLFRLSVNDCRFLRTTKKACRLKEDKYSRRTYIFPRFFVVWSSVSTFGVHRIVLEYGTNLLF